MELKEMSNRIHPLVAAAAVSVIVVSALGAAALTGVLPNTHATNAPTATIEEQTSSVSKAPVQASQSKKHSNNALKQAQAETGQQTAAAPTPAAKPAPHNSAIGIGVGAVVGGLLGNQVGNGDGKTLATIAGAVGGGYVGNEIAKKNQ